MCVRGPVIMERLSVFTKSTFILVCLNVHTKDFAQKLRNNQLRGYARQLSSVVGSPEPTWHPCKGPVLRLPPPPRAFRHHVIANVVQRLQRRYGLVVIEAVGEPSRLSMGKEFAFATNGQVQRNLWPLTDPRWAYKKAVFPVVEIRIAQRGHSKLSVQ